jgi:DNA-binding response OmpR family regulator/tetratricopeptide (TPR) repeat protein
VRSILLAEGHGPTREFVTQSLTGAGFQVLAAADPERAYELYAAERPEAVILAADFGDDAGTALAQRLREADPRVLVVVVDKEHLGRARGISAVLPMKANAYVADPTKKELLDKVQHLVQQRAPARPSLHGAALVLSRPPSAQGEVKPAVVARLLHQIWRAFAEGILVLEEGGVERRLLFLRGAPVAFQSADPDDSLVAWMASSARLDEGARATALEGMASGLSPGAALIAAGVLEPGEPLQAAMRAHLEAMVARTVGRKDGRWRFHSGPEFVAEVHPVEILPLQALLEGARAGVPARHFADGLKAVMEAYPARTGEFPQLLPAAGLSSADLRLALGLDGRVTTREFLDSRKDLKEALSLLWFLSLVGAVAFRDEPAGGDAYARPAPRKKKALPPDRAEALRQAALQILPGTYFHALGVDIAADAQEVERAYHEVASRFHPDSFAEYDVGDLDDLLAAVQDKVTAALRVLSNEEKRRSYLSFLVLKMELAGARRPSIDVDAEVALKKGERALLLRKNAEAVAALAAAVERNPREPEYHAMLGFAELFDPVLPRSQRAAEARKNAKKALQLEPSHPRGTAVLALAEELGGDLAEARKTVLAGLKAHPENEVLKRVLHRLNRVVPAAGQPQG